jgi:LCP family protein required for cell wall assembly
VPQQSKPYKVYRGGHARTDDPDAARFSFGSGAAGTVQPPPPATPDGMPSPLADGENGGPPGRKVATVPSRRRFRPGWKKGILIGLGVVLLLFMVQIYRGYHAFSQEMARANARLDPKTKKALTPVGNPLTNPQVTIVLGSDSRGKGTTARTDSILLTRTDPGKHTISMLSIPRDMWVPIPGHGSAKINAAYAWGGTPLLIKTVEHFTGLPVNHVVLVDFTGFEDLINALGGVNIDNPYRIDSSQPFDGKLWHFKQGPLHMFGTRALAYARIRHTTNAKDTDITRTERQQRVMQAIAHQLVSPGNLLHLDTVGGAIAKPLTTDLSANEVLEMGWVKWRSQQTIQCHLGGTPQFIDGQDAISSSSQNMQVVGMFLGKVAPMPPARGELYAPGCTKH